MPLTEVYYLGLIPAVVIYTARALWLAKQPSIQAHSRLRKILAMCMLCAVTWPLSIPIGVLIKTLEWTHRQDWLTRCVNWAQRTLEQWRP